VYKKRDRSFVAVLAVSFGLVVLPSTLRANNYYVSTDGSNVAGDGSHGNPWRTVAYAVANVANKDTINLFAGDYLAPAGIKVDKSLNFKGITGYGNIRIQAAPPWPATNTVFVFGSGVTNLLQSLTVRYGDASGHGGGISNAGVLTVDSCTVEWNSAGGNGGGIYNTGDLTVSYSTFRKNSGTGGGAIYTDGGLYVNICTLRDNTAGSGGALYVAGSGLGVDVDNSSLVDNSAWKGGGAYVANGVADFANTDINENRGGGYGGGVYVSAGWVTFDGGTIGKNNVPGSDGGGICITGGHITVEDSLFVTNVAGIYGGALAVSGGGSASLVNCTISGNTATNSGGGTYVSAGTAAFTNCTIAVNTALTSDGGGICVAGGTARIYDTVIGDNVSGNRGTNCFGAMTSDGYNLIEDTNHCTVGGTTTGNIYGQDPQLGPLRFNGGGSQTHAIQMSGPAFNAGDKSFSPPPWTDGRGGTYPRIQSGRVDMGAYELTSTFSITNLGRGSAYDITGDVDAWSNATYRILTSSSLTGTYTPVLTVSDVDGDFSFTHTNGMTNTMWRFYNVAEENWSGMTLTYGSPSTASVRKVSVERDMR